MNSEFYLLKPYLDEQNRGMLVIKDMSLQDDWGKSTWRAILFWSSQTCIGEVSTIIFDETINAPATAGPDEVAEDALGFFTQCEGDTNQEYFDAYTPEQLSWRDEHAEYVGALVDDVGKYRII